MPRLPPPSWYDEYFFDLDHGHAAYWLKQSSNGILIEGRVFGWFFDYAPFPLNDRTTTAQYVVNRLTLGHGIRLLDFDAVIVVLGRPASVKPDRGKTDVKVVALADPLLPLRDRGDGAGFARAGEALSERIGVPDLGFHVTDRRERLRLTRPGQPLFR